MKKFICIALVFILSFGLIACSNYVTDEDGEKATGFLNYVMIEEYNDGYQLYWLTYDKTNMICYDIINPRASSRTITPHIIIENGVAFLSMYKNGEIIPVPFGVMNSETIKNWFN